MEIEWAEVLYTEPEEGDAFRSHQQGSKESRGLQILQCYCDTPKTRESLFIFPIDMKTVIQILCFFLLITFYKCAVITGACEKDLQCGPGTCCAISLWLRGLRMCTPLGQEGDECHPFSHKIPFFGKRQHHACPCLPNFICSKFTDGRYRCSIDFKNIDF